MNTDFTTRSDDEEHTGKRDAVRNNSGQPVGHSGPGLGVGPTNPTTAGRKPAACPPSGFDVGGGVDFRDAISQHKSGQGSGGGTPGGANEESAVLRSAATQRGSSLDEIQNNRNIRIANGLNSLGRKGNCGAWTIVGSTAEGKRIYRRLNCKMWPCPYCGPRKAKRYKFLIAQLAEREQLTRFLTLTLDPSKIKGDSVRYLRQVFNKFRVYLRRKYGVQIKYIAVLEFQKSGIAHLHLLVNQYIPHHWISQSWDALGGGRMVFIKSVDVHRVSRYLSKYLTKELLLSAPQRSRRVTTSRSLKLIPARESEDVWTLFKTSIFHFYERLYSSVSEFSLDEQGILESFVCVAEIA